MIVFVTSLRHPRNSDDYAHVETLLSETLASIAGQTCDDYAIIVVGNQVPAVPLPPRTTFVQVDFPPPVADAGPQFALGPFVRDKGTKIGVGLLAARELHPDHVMIVDADDYVHRDLARLSADHPDANGWLVQDGWILSRARGVYRPQPRFFGVCGTSHIVAWRAYEVPGDLEVTAAQEQVEEAFGERLGAIIGAHRNARIWLSKHGNRLEPLPFPAAVYQVDTGENHSGKTLRGVGRPIGRALLRDFGVPRTRPLPASWWSAYAPSEVLWTVKERRERRRAARTKS